MKNETTHETKVSRLTPLAAWVAAIAIVFIAQPAHADHVTPPNMPAEIQVPAGNKPYLMGHAVGTQNYICLPSGAGFAWTLFGPQATLFDDDFKQVITHFLSPNPYEPGAPPRATWQHSRDTSETWAVMTHQSSDPVFVRAGAIPWFRLQKVGVQDGPTGGHKLTRTTWVQRLNTIGGVAPATGCAMAADVGKKMLVPYEADYYFYRDANDDEN